MNGTVKIYRLGTFAKRELGNGSNHLVTRETGRVIRERIERELQAEKSGVMVALDFSEAGVIDFSCADEIVAKLVSRLLSGEYGDKYLILTGLNSNHRENLQVALERKKLAALVIGNDHSWETLGVLLPYLEETLKVVMEDGRITAKELAQRLSVEVNTSGTRLLNLYKLRLCTRTEEPQAEKGRQFVYTSLAQGREKGGNHRGLPTLTQP